MPATAAGTAPAGQHGGATLPANGPLDAHTTQRTQRGETQRRCRTLLGRAVSLPVASRSNGTRRGTLELHAYRALPARSRSALPSSLSIPSAAEVRNSPSFFFFSVFVGLNHEQSFATHKAETGRRAASHGEQDASRQGGQAARVRGWSVQEFHPVTGRVACTNTRSPERASSWSRVAARVNAHACASALWLGLIGVCCGTPTCASAITAGSHGRELRAARGAVARGKPAASVQPGRLCARAPPAASAGSCTRVHALCCAYMCNTHRWRHGIARARVRVRSVPPAAAQSC